VHRVIRPQLARGPAGNFHGRRIEGRHHQQQRVVHERRRIALGVVRDRS